MTPSLIEHRAREAEYYRRVLPAWKAHAEAVREMQAACAKRLAELIEARVDGQSAPLNTP